MQFSVKKLVSLFRYEDPESISGLTFPVSAEQLNGVSSCDFQPNMKRTEAYDLQRMKFFVEHPDEIKDIEFEYDGETVVINDGNHRFMAALYLGLETVCGELFGYQDILDEIKDKQEV